jgi:hypothetical protein
MLWLAMRVASSILLLFTSLSLAAKTPEGIAWTELANEILALSDGPAIQEVKTCEREIQDMIARVARATSNAERERHEHALKTWRERHALALKRLAETSDKQKALFAELRRYILPAFVAHSEVFAGRVAGHNWQRQLNVPLERDLGRTAQQALRVEAVYIRSLISQLENAKALDEFRPQTQGLSRWRQRLERTESALREDFKIWHQEGVNSENLVNHKQCLQFLAELSGANLRIAQYEVELDERSPAQRTVLRMQEQLAEIDRELQSVLEQLNAGRSAREQELYRRAAIVADEIDLLERLLEDKDRPLTPKATQGVHRDLRAAHRQREEILAEVRSLKKSRWRADDAPRR